MQAIIKYWRIFKVLTAASASAAMTFRLTFVLLVAMDLLFYLTTILGVDFIFDHLVTIGPWSRTQFLFFLGFMLAVDQLHMTFVSEGFWSFSLDLRSGQFDMKLLRPVATPVLVYLNLIRIPTMMLLPVPWSIMIYYGMDLGLSGLQWMLIFPLVILALALQFLIEVTLSMTMFWTVQSYGVNFLRMQVQHMSRWPNFVFGQWTRRIFTFALPILLIGSAPVHTLLGTDTWHLLLPMVISIVVLFYVNRILWRFGVSRYESASS